VRVDWRATARSSLLLSLDAPASTTQDLTRWLARAGRKDRRRPTAAGGSGDKEGEASYTYESRRAGRRRAPRTRVGACGWQSSSTGRHRRTRDL